MQAISTTNAPAAIGPYSQAVEHNGTIYISGQLPIDPATGEFAKGDIKDLARQSLNNIKNILASEGLTMANVIKVTVMMTDMANFADINAVYAEFFTAPYPARSAYAVAALPKNGLVEIEAIAVR